MTPLVAIDAVAFDTETTGLDVRSAELIEIGAVRLAGGVLLPGTTYRSLIRPNGRISPDSSRIHGIDDAMLEGAPGFADVWLQFDEFSRESVLIGHTIGFDLAILERELVRHNLTWRRPRMLDTQLLAQIAIPRIGKASLDDLAARLDVEIAGRHTALGDARLAAQVFLALVPLLLNSGIRSLEEAETSSRSLIETLDDYRRAGWVEPVAMPGLSRVEAASSRRDFFPYRRRVADVMSAPPVMVRPEQPISETLQHMQEQRISSVFVTSDTDAALAENSGIVTERDLLRVFLAHRDAAFDMKTGAVMSRPLLTVPEDAFVYLAIARMRRLQLRHLAVVDAKSQIVGAVSARDLLRMHAEPANVLGDEIEQAQSAQSLSAAWSKLQLGVASMVADIPARELAGLISQVLGELTAQAAVLAERDLAQQGLGPPPCPYAVVVLGSAGRDESLLGADQDNAIIFQTGGADGLEDRWFAALGSALADLLHTAGIPYCPGNVMARNPVWRGSLSTWEARILGWIERSSPADLLSVDIFFDLKPVHGDLELARSLWAWSFEQARDNVAFAKLLVESSAAHVDRGLTWFGTINGSNGRVDLKRSGSFPLVSAARALAIRHGVVERSSFLRFTGLSARELGHDVDLERFQHALALFLGLIVKQQVRDMAQGHAPSNKVALAALTRYERDELREALSSIRHVQEFVRDLLF